MPEREGGTDRVDLERQRELAVKLLENATTAYKRMRKMRGVDAHQRSWHFKEQMDKAQERIQKLDAELEKLTKNAGSSMA